MAESSNPAEAPPKPESPKPSPHGNDPSTKGFFQQGAVELAKGLLGHYLYLHESKIVLKILETEAYPDGDEVYQTKFPNVGDRFKVKGGKVVVWAPPNHPGGHSAGGLYITAGTKASGDLVAIRSCEPIQGVKEIMTRRMVKEVKKEVLVIGPLNVFDAVGKDWQSNPVLYKNGGAQLFYQKPGESVTKLHGKRVLTGMQYRECDGIDEKYRFALQTETAYRYKNKSALVEMAD